MEIGLLLFIMSTITFYLMYYFYQPGTAVSQNRNARRKHETKSVESTDHIRDSFASVQMVSEAILRAGVSKARLLLGIDLTASNEWQGRVSFNRNNLHKLHPVKPVYNPYQRVISILGKTLQPFTEPDMVFAYGFGDIITQDSSVFNIAGEEGTACRDFREVLGRYNEMVKEVVHSGPTSFAPIIRRSMRHVVESGNKFHILVIIADGQMDDEGPTVAAIIEASHLPLSIILVGVGDGPWDIMEEFDDHLPGREFDNFQFVDFQSMQERRNPEAAFALAALMEVPVQFQTMGRRGHFSGKGGRREEEQC